MDEFTNCLLNILNSFLLDPFRFDDFALFGLNLRIKDCRLFIDQKVDLLIKMLGKSATNFAFE